MLNHLNSFAKFHPYNLAIVIDIGEHFLSSLEMNNEIQASKYLKLFFRQIETNEISEETVDFINNNFSAESKYKTMIHYTSFIHESKHFHDYMLSPVGNYIIRRYFYLYAYVYPILGELSNECEEVIIPLHYMEILNSSNLSEAIKHFIKSTKSAIDESIRFLNSTPELDKNDMRSKNYKISGNDIFEASAVITQFSQIEDSFGFETSMEFQLYLKETIPSYTDTIETLQLLLAQHNKDEGFVLQDNELLSTILFASLCGNFSSEYKIDSQNPSERFALIMSFLLKNTKIKIDKNDIFNYVESLSEEYGLISMKKSLYENLELNEKHYILVEKILSTNFDINSQSSKGLLDSYRFFINYNKKLTTLFLKKPNHYLQPLSYIKYFLPNMPVPTIIEEYSGFRIPMYLDNKILNENKIEYVMYDNIHERGTFNKYWAIMFKNNLSNLSPKALYTTFSPLFFTLTRGEKANYDLVNPRASDLLYKYLPTMNIKLREAYPTSTVQKSKQKMQKYFKLKKLTYYHCDICEQRVNSNIGHLICGNSLYKNKNFNCFLEKTSNNNERVALMYKCDYSFYAICTKCFEIFRLA